MLFRQKYLNEARLSGKVREFVKLTQGNMSVADYVAKFDALARFVPSMVANDSARRLRFMMGLNLDMVQRVDSGETGPQSYADAVQRALRIDGWNDKNEKPKESTDARKGAELTSRKEEQFSDKKNNFVKRKGNWRNKRSYDKFSGKFIKGNAEPNEVKTEGTVQVQPQCKKCGNYHRGSHLDGSLVCYNCGKEGHYSQNCPSKKESTQANKQ